MFGDPFSKKEGLLRNTVFGGRTPFAFRSVIVSESGVHDYEQIKIPYSQAVTMFKVHLLNKLYKKGYTHRDAWEYIDRHTITRDALLEELLYEIFQEAPGGKGVRCLFVRYPTLARGSIQALHINDISDNVSSLSVLCTRAPNADFLV
jgi:DNA-directed RNA polymerase beta' subunit